MTAWAETAPAPALSPKSLRYRANEFLARFRRKATPVGGRREAHDAARVAAEGLDVVSHPRQGQPLVEEGPVPRRRPRPGVPERVRAEEAKDAEAVVERDQHGRRDVAVAVVEGHQLPSVELVVVAPAPAIAPAVDEDLHGQGPPAAASRGEDVQEQAVLSVRRPHRRPALAGLQAVRAPGRRVHEVPRSDLRRWHGSAPAPLPGRCQTISNAEEGAVCRKIRPDVASPTSQACQGHLTVHLQACQGHRPSDAQ